MQRLSLDSSASKLYSYGGRKDDTYDIDDLKPASSSPSSSSSAADYDDHELKDYKPRRFSSLQSPFATTNKKQEKLVHFIPILTLICFIILYLTSHVPSQSDLAQFNGFMRPSKHLESDENGEISGFIRADTLAIRSSVRNLQETESFAAKSLPRRRTSHRKTADF
ncbi:unnamed protein product [Arabidopsis lyrata]|uniref:Uncharacterized protein n=1 Tax=Arabidopsis lyrata subsp. lyrata TaxID=81972 RepID=D7LHW6_ARALL|nr:uncharacterized protein LOC9315620 [Arabidopsis lyrata subsp. lyrata]EFH57657.1 hypothetical protein ARALYDRAFT_482509 [Arabidopsis lyrata subsp. lyrata]CAH8264818.1 unnamed protein product [Arabidopsis lyrata]|eukprot:XP_020885828.1 uncharacterized protein LOC9315620 [Arabidopsis lyrata subsp. lyrata]